MARPKAAPAEPKAADAPASDVPEGCVLMERDGTATAVRDNESVQIMEALGWQVVKA